MLTLKDPVSITIHVGDVNAVQVVRATIECPTEDNVSVVLDVQGSMVDDNGGVSWVIPLPRIVLDPVKAADLYATVRGAIYDAVRVTSPDMSAEAVLAPLVVKDVTP